MLNLLNNLIKVSGKQGGTIHDYLNMAAPETLDYFFEMNKTIIINGWLTKEQLLGYAVAYGVTLKNI